MELTRIRIAQLTHIKNRYIHLIVIGKTGTGKSVMLQNIFDQDCWYPYSKIVIEPSGFLAKDCYSIIRGKTQYCSLTNPISLNPMTANYPPEVIAETVAEAINQLIIVTTSNQTLTVKMRSILTEEVVWCLGNGRRALSFVLDRIINRRGDIEARDGLIHRLKFILSDERANRIICGERPFDFQTLIDKGESLILDCEKMGREKMIFCGTIIAQGLKNYMRFGNPEKPVVFYADECHNFLNQSFFDILKEGRKYKLSCVLATQDFAVIDKNFARVMLNVGNIVCFRSGNIESRLIAGELNFKPDQIQFLDKYHFVYLTEKDTGTAKALRPPFFKTYKPKLAERKPKSTGWFPLVSC